MIKGLQVGGLLVCKKLIVKVVAGLLEMFCGNIFCYCEAWYL